MDRPGKELILIIHQEGKYYIVNKQKPAPENPKVYIIPDDQIKFASIIRSPVSYSDFSLKYFEKKIKRLRKLRKEDTNPVTNPKFNT